MPCGLHEGGSQDERKQKAGVTVTAGGIYSLSYDGVVYLTVGTIELGKQDETKNRLGHVQILQLLKFCLKTYFIFDGTVHEQVKGARMGSPIAGLIAEEILKMVGVAGFLTSQTEVLSSDLAIEIIELLLQSKYDETENRLGHAQILHLLKFCLRTYFMFDVTIYEQVKGTPMGSPISGFIAEAVLQRLESLVFQHHKPKFWAR
ncbi:hypothetical protein SprV_0802581700 [Sparganum proliferum]